MLNKIRKKINDKIVNINYSTMCDYAASLCNSETFKQYKCYFEGEDIAICGAGPTLNDYKRKDGVHHIALNRALLNNNINYEWFIADDWDGVSFMQEELIKYDCVKFFGQHFIGEYFREIPESFVLSCNAKKYYVDNYTGINPFNSRFIREIDKMPIGSMPNIALSAMQIALFTHPKRIYIVGCDASRGHYVQPKGIDNETYKRHEKDLKMAVCSAAVIHKWIELKEFASAIYPDVEIVSINPVGLRGIFKDEFQE